MTTPAEDVAYRARRGKAHRLVRSSHTNDATGLKTGLTACGFMLRDAAAHKLADVTPDGRCLLCWPLTIRGTRR